MFLFGCLRACASSNSESGRASRALGAARPSYLSAAISMWMLQLFGCGIFPHTGSYQSRLTGHCLHSITERPGLEKKNTHKRQMSSLKPCSTLHPPPSSLHSTFHPPKKPAVSSSPRDEQECAVTVLYSGEPLAYSLQEQHYTCKKEGKKRPNLFPQNSREDTIEW